MLKLDELFKLFEELETSGLLGEAQGDYEAKLKAMTPEQKVLELIIPKMQIAGNTIGNQEVLDRFVKTLGGKSVGQKLQSLNVQMTKAGKVSNSKKNLSVLTEKVAILDALATMFREFEASPAGFLNETFVAAFIGGSKIPAGVGNAEKIVTDVKGEDGIQYSIKTLTLGSDVDGSAFNLCNTVEKYGSVTYLIFIKDQSTGETSAYTMYEYIIDKKNLFNIPLKGSEGTVGDVYNKYKNKLPYLDSKREIPQPKGLEEAEITDLQVQAAEEKAAQAQEKTLAADQKLTKAKQKEEEKDLARKFVIPESLWKKGKTVTVNFSTDAVLTMLAQSIGDAINRIEQLHLEIRKLTQNMSQYFTEADPQRKQALGEEMLQSSREVEPKTKDVVKEE